MAGYRHLLLAVDLSGESGQVVERATALRNAFGAQMSVTHVIEPLSFAYGGDIPMDFSGIQEEIHKQARSHMAALCDPLNIPEANRHLVVGRPETEIHHVSEEIGADLIVVTEIYASGTTPIPGVTGKLVVDAIRAAHPDARVEWIPERGDLVTFLATELKVGDLCISMGCGDIETLPDEVIAARAGS